MLRRIQLLLHLGISLTIFVTINPSLFKAEKIKQNIHERLINTISGFNNPFHTTFSPDGKTIIANDNNALHLLSLQTGKLILTLPSSASIDTIVFSPNGQTIVGVTKSADTGLRIIKVWNLKTGKLLHNVVFQELSVL